MNVPHQNGSKVSRFSTRWISRRLAQVVQGVLCISLLFVSTSEKSLAFVPSVHWACYRGSRSRRTALQPSWVSRSIGFARRNCAALKRRASGAGWGLNHPGCTYHVWLVVWNIWMIFPNSWYDDHMIQSDLTNIFQRGRSTTNQMCVCVILNHPKWGYTQQESSGGMVHDGSIYVTGVSTEYGSKASTGRQYGGRSIALLLPSEWGGEHT